MPNFIKTIGLGLQPHACHDYKIPNPAFFSTGSEPAVATAVAALLTVLEEREPERRGHQNLYVRTTFRIPGNTTIRHQFHWDYERLPALRAERIEFLGSRTIPAYCRPEEDDESRSILVRLLSQCAADALPLPAQTLRRMVAAIQRASTGEQIATVKAAMQQENAHCPSLLILDNALISEAAVADLSRKTHVIALGPGKTKNSPEGKII